MTTRKYPIGIQTFSEIIREGYVYVDKEGFYEYTMYLIFSMLNVYVRTQVKCARGRVDLVVDMPDIVYVFELKVKQLFIRHWELSRKGLQREAYD